MIANNFLNPEAAMDKYFSLSYKHNISEQGSNSIQYNSKNL